jgi:hypothetical protein
MTAGAPAGFKLITAVLPVQCDALGVMDGLRTELGVLAADVHPGRGVSHLSARRSRRRIGDMSEKKILTAIVRDDQAEAVFAYVHDKAEIGRAHGGLVYQQPLLRSTVYELPDLGPDSKRP